MCRFCGKSQKLPGDSFHAIGQSDRRPPICVDSITLPRSPVSLSSGDEVPHIFTRKSHLRPGEFLITSAKRLLQQNLPQPDSCPATNHCYSITSSAVATSVVGTVSPRAFAVLTLIASSYLVGACTGRSAGFFPLGVGFML